jgi:signal transduction histidine kinase
LNIDVTYEQIDGLNDIKLTLKNKQHLLLVLKEGINNAIKHGDKKHIKLEWIVINGKQTIIITNTTHNIAINNKFTISTGIGLNSMQERMKKIGGNITYSSTPKQFQIKYHLNFLK